MNGNTKIIITIIALAIAVITLASIVHAAPANYNEALALFAQPARLDASIPESARGILGTHNWLIIISNGNTAEYYWMTTQSGHVTATGRGRRTTPPVTATVMTSRSTIDTILASADPNRATLGALQRGAIRIQYSSGAAGWRLRAAIGAANLGLLGSAEQVSQGKPAGAVCQHGGECESSNCVGTGQGPPWTYRCSCDPFRYTTSGCTADASLVPRTKPNGETCAHGGECQSGNCVGTGMGPPWTYACSCDPFVYRASC
jgi:hypothetical protein